MLFTQVLEMHGKMYGEVQGSLFSKPLPNEGMIAYLKKAQSKNIAFPILKVVVPATPHLR